MSDRDDSLFARLSRRLGRRRPAAGERGVLDACLGPLEVRVLESLWRRRAAASVRELMGEFPGVAYTTLMTTLDRLYKNGVTVRGKRGRAYAYAPRHGRADLEAILARDALADLLREGGRGPEPVLAGFVEAVGRRDASMLDDLERLVRRYRAGLADEADAEDAS